MDHAARLLLEGGYEIDVVFTSRLKRAIKSVWFILQEMDQVHLPVFKSWRLVRSEWYRKSMLLLLAATICVNLFSSVASQP